MNKLNCIYFYNENSFHAGTPSGIKTYVDGKLIAEKGISFDFNAKKKTGDTRENRAIL